MLPQILETEQRLRSLGIAPGMRVAFYCPNSSALVVTMVACWRIGAVVVPLSTRYSEEQVANAIEGMLCDVLISDEDMTSRPLISFAQDAKTAKKIKVLTLCDLGVFARDKNELYATHQKRVECHFKDVTLDDLNLDLSQQASIVLTSGSTGQPKGVLHTLANHVASARASHEVIPFGQDDVWLVSLPLYHVGGLALIVRALLHGGSLLFPEQDWQSSLVNERITHLSVVSTQLKRLLDGDETVQALCKLKAVLVGGAFCPEHLIERCVELGIHVHITYGCSEAASQVTTTRDKPIGSGQALGCVKVEIAKDEEILIQSESLCQGYMVKGQIQPVTDKQGWFHTGDLGELDGQGHLFVKGRKDCRFISGGENIYPEEIERVLMAIPELLQCVVVPVDHPEFGHRPVAFLHAQGDLPCKDVLRDALKTIERFKHPDHYFQWPDGMLGTMKPERGRFEKLACNLAGEL